MFRSFTLVLAVLGLLGPVLAQDTGSSVLAAGRKRLEDAVGRKGAELTAVLEDGLRLLKTVPARFPEDRASSCRAWLEVGRVEKRLGRSTEAEAAFRKVLETPAEERPCCDALHDLATLHRKAKNADAAKAALQEVIDRFPGQPMERAHALIRLAGFHRDAKAFEQAEECLRRCLKEHGDLWRPAVDALDDLVALKLRQKETDEARKILDSHTEALRARFGGTGQEERIERALQKMPSRARLDGTVEAGDGGGPGGREEDGGKGW